MDFSLRDFYKNKNVAWLVARQRLEPEPKPKEKKMVNLAEKMTQAVWFHNKGLRQARSKRRGLEPNTKRKTVFRFGYF